MFMSNLWSASEMTCLNENSTAGSSMISLSSAVPLGTALLRLLCFDVTLLRLVYCRRIFVRRS